LRCEIAQLEDKVDVLSAELSKVRSDHNLG
jgi:hypothetical protein